MSEPVIPDGLKFDDLSASARNAILSMIGSLFPALELAYAELFATVPGLAKLPREYREVVFVRMLDSGVLRIVRDKEGGKPIFVLEGRADDGQYVRL